MAGAETSQDAIRAQRRAVTAVFAVNGATFSSWLPRIPEVRDRLGLDLDDLGLVLLGGGLGGLLASAAGGALVDRLGSRRATVVAAVVLSMALPLIGVAPGALALAVVLVGLGGVDVLADIGMNVQAAQVQRRSAGSVIQRFHASWSVGAVLGGLAATGAAATGVDLRVQLAVTGIVLVGVVGAAAGSLSPVDDVASPAPEGARRLPVLVLLALVATTVAVTEGVPGEWAAVFGRDVHGVGPGVAGLGYLAVSIGMVGGRVAGDAITDRLGAPRLFQVALVTVGVGIAIVAASPVEAVAIGGFLVTGTGVSVLFPALYLQAADTPGVPAGLGIGVMSTGARLGFLVSPPVVGGVATATSLRVSVGAVVGVAVVLALGLAAGLRRAS